MKFEDEAMKSKTDISFVWGWLTCFISFSAAIGGALLSHFHVFG